MVKACYGAHAQSICAARCEFRETHKDATATNMKSPHAGFMYLEKVPDISAENASCSACGSFHEAVSR